MARRDISMKDISDTGFRCVPASNGGWVVFEVTEPNFISAMIGAYSDTAALLSGLSTLLAPPTSTAPAETVTGVIQ